MPLPYRPMRCRGYQLYICICSFKFLTITGIVRSTRRSVYNNLLAALKVDHHFWNMRHMDIQLSSLLVLYSFLILQSSIAPFIILDTLIFIYPWHLVNSLKPLLYKTSILASHYTFICKQIAVILLIALFLKSDLFEDCIACAGREKNKAIK